MPAGPGQGVEASRYCRSNAVLVVHTASNEQRASITRAAAGLGRLHARKPGISRNPPVPSECWLGRPAQSSDASPIRMTRYDAPALVSFLPPPQFGRRATWLRRRIARPVRPANSRGTREGEALFHVNVCPLAGHRPVLGQGRPRVRHRAPRLSGVLLPAIILQRPAMERVSICGTRRPIGRFRISGFALHATMNYTQALGPVFSRSERSASIYEVVVGRHRPPKCFLCDMENDRLG